MLVSNKPSHYVYLDYYVYKNTQKCQNYLIFASFDERLTDICIVARHEDTLAFSTADSCSVAYVFLATFHKIINKILLLHPVWFIISFKSNPGK